MIGGTHPMTTGNLPISLSADSKDYAKLGYNELMTICTCKGRIPQGEPVCDRNQEGKKRDNGYCRFYRANGTYHCDKQLEKG